MPEAGWCETSLFCRCEHCHQPEPRVYPRAAALQVLAIENPHRTVGRLLVGPIAAGVVRNRKDLIGENIRRHLACARERLREIRTITPDLSRRDAEIIFTLIFDQIAAGLSRGDRVELRGFGAFWVKKRDAHTSRNPRTGDKVAISEKYFPAFRAGKRLRDHLKMH